MDTVKDTVDGSGEIDRCSEEIIGVIGIYGEDMCDALEGRHSGFPKRIKTHEELPQARRGVRMEYRHHAYKERKCIVDNDYFLIES